MATKKVHQYVECTAFVGSNEQGHVDYQDCRLCIHYDRLEEGHVVCEAPQHNGAEVSVKQG